VPVPVPVPDSGHALGRRQRSQLHPKLAFLNDAELFRGSTGEINHPIRVPEWPPVVDPNDHPPPVIASDLDHRPEGEAAVGSRQQTRVIAVSVGGLPPREMPRIVGREAGLEGRGLRVRRSWLRSRRRSGGFRRGKGRGRGTMPSAAGSEHHEREVYVLPEAHLPNKGLSQVYHRDARCD